MAPLTAAEKQRRYKEKLKKDPEKYEEYKRKKRELYHAKKRLVKDLTPKEHHNAKVIWKLKKRERRTKLKVLNQILTNTPPSSPLHMEENILQPLLLENIQNMDVVQDVEPIVADQGCVENMNAKNKKKTKGRKKVRRDRTKLFRENLKLQKENKNLKRIAEKYKKRYFRNKRKDAVISPVPTDEIKYKKLTNAIRDRYKMLKKNRDKKAIKTVFQSIAGSGREDIIRESLGITGQMRSTTKLRNSATELKKTIHSFFIRDDISRQTAGKKETVTKAKKKMQKRFLLDSMKNLFKTFKKEFPSKKCSYYYFTKNRPYFVVKPSVDGREMCLCKVHINPVYKAHVLKKRRLIETDDLSMLITATVCDSEKQECMYGTCQDCENKEVGLHHAENSEIAKWFEWIREEVVYEKNGKKMKAFKNVKKEREDEIKNLIRLFNTDLKILKKHIFNMKKQYKCFRDAIDHLHESEMVLVADFSENYNCKLHQEIQAHHFGGSRQQVSLHTVVVYLYNGETKREVKSYCTISSSLSHQPAAIWTHLHPILQDIRKERPEISTIHFFSDGPFSQYRQKQNFYLSSTKTFDYGFKEMTWSFFEAGHGKGPADGIGGYLKRTADGIVATGNDISDAKQFYDVLKNKSKIMLYLISPSHIDELSQQLLPNIATLKGTLHVHQVFTSIRGQLQYRNLSCFCKRGFCQCLNPKIYYPIMDKHANDKDFNGSVDDTCTTDDDSSDDVPLSLLRNTEQSNIQDIDVIDLCRPRKEMLYDTIYNDHDEPSTSARGQEDNENRPVRSGDYLLVNVHATKGKIYRYVCKVNYLDDDGDISVTFLRNVKKCQVFRLDPKDISYLDYADIIKILPEPTIKIKPGEQYIEFTFPIDIYEK